MAAQIEREGSDAVSCVGLPTEGRDVALSPRQLEAGRRPDHADRQRGPHGAFSDAERRPAAG